MHDPEITVTTSGTDLAGQQLEDIRAAHTQVDKVNRQEAPDPQPLRDLLASLSYKDGWRFELADTDRGQGSKGLTLQIIATVPDSYNPDRKLRVWHYMPVPPAAYDLRSWQRWLLDQVLLVEQHEAMEFFQIGDRRPYAPNHGPGRNPYTIHELGIIADAETDFRGHRDTGTQK